jgi:hypothetical protein
MAHHAAIRLRSVQACCRWAKTADLLVSDAIWSTTPGEQGTLSLVAPSTKLSCSVDFVDPLQHDMGPDLMDVNKYGTTSQANTMFHSSW